jgi:hypothetical protein
MWQVLVNTKYIAFVGEDNTKLDATRFRGPEGRQIVATPARAWTTNKGAVEPRSGERFSRRFFRHSVADAPWKPIPTAHAVGYSLTALRA